MCNYVCSGEGLRCIDLFCGCWVSRLIYWPHICCFSIQRSIIVIASPFPRRPRLLLLIWAHSECSYTLKPCQDKGNSAGPEPEPDPQPKPKPKPEPEPELKKCSLRIHLCAWALECPLHVSETTRKYDAFAEVCKNCTWNTEHRRHKNIHVYV